MVSEEGDWVMSALEVVVPVVQSMNYCKKFLVIDIIISLSGGKHCGDVSTGVEISIPIMLHKDSTTGKEGGIGHNHKETLHIGKVENRGGLKVGQ